MTIYYNVRSEEELAEISLHCTCIVRAKLHCAFGKVIDKPSFTVNNENRQLHIALAHPCTTTSHACHMHLTCSEPTLCGNFILPGTLYMYITHTSPDADDVRAITLKVQTTNKLTLPRDSLRSNHKSLSGGSWIHGEGAPHSYIL